MNVFTVDPNQCYDHFKTLYKDGPNSIYTLMKRNQVGNWGMIKDTNPVTEEQETTKFGKKGRGEAGEAEDASKVEALLNRRAELDRKRFANPNQRGKTGALKKTGACQTGAKAGWRGALVA